FTNKGVWYLAGYSSDDGIRKLWRIECNRWTTIAEKDISNIEASGDNKYVFAVSEGAVLVFDPANYNSYVTIAPADPAKEYTGIAFDDKSMVLYVSEKAAGYIARFTGEGRDWHPLETMRYTKLDGPTTLRFALGKLYVKEEWAYAGLPSIEGDDGFTAAPDGFLYYRKDVDSVYRVPLENPVGPGELYAGNLVNYKPTGGIVMQDYFEGPDFRFLN
ncbi:hypothetical protein FOZ62_016372, partial [Perkinsus olseni]